MSKNGQYNLEMEEKISGVQIDIVEIKSQMTDVADRVYWLEKVKERECEAHVIDKHFPFFIALFVTLAFFVIKYL